MWTYLLIDGIEPVANVGAGNFGDGLAKFTLCFLIISEEFGKIVDSIEEGDPAVICSLVEWYFFRGVESAKFKWFGQVGGIFVAWLFWKVGSGNSSWHF